MELEVLEKKKIIIVGCGPGSEAYVPPAAAAAVRKADVLIVSKRLGGLFPDIDAERIDSGVDVPGTLAIIASRRDAGKQVVLLATGDPGIFSLAQPVIGRFGRENCEVIPGISSLQVAFARLCLPWYDAVIISAHEKNPEITADELRNAEKIAILGGRTEGLQWMAELLKTLGKERRIFLCEELTLPEERVTEIQPHELTTLKVSSRAIVIAIRRELLED